jgi:hypothetical protein
MQTPPVRECCLTVLKASQGGQSPEMKGERADPFRCLAYFSSSREMSQGTLAVHEVHPPVRGMYVPQGFGVGDIACQVARGNVGSHWFN